MIHYKNQNRSTFIKVDIHIFFCFRYDALCILLRHSKNVRFWFAHNVLFNVSNRFSEYLLECPSAEVRGAFAKLIVFIAHFSLQDGPCPSSFTSPGLTGQVIESFSVTVKYKSILFPCKIKSLNICVCFTCIPYIYSHV